MKNGTLNPSAEQRTALTQTDGFRLFGRKTELRLDRRSGKILIVTLVLGLLVSLTVGALLVIAKNQRVISARSATWSSAIPIAEAGIEEAMAHLNSTGTTNNLAVNGWTRQGTHYTKIREFPEGYFYSRITLETLPTVMSVGHMRLPLQTNFLHRTIMVTTKKGPPPMGFVSKGPITMSGSVSVDSFDSSNPLYSTGGLYDPAKRRDNAGIATLSTNQPAINTGTADVYGNVATGAGGTAIGNVGDGTWNATQSGIQPGHSFDDFNVAITDVALPAVLSVSLPPTSGMVDGTFYKWVLGNGDFAMPSLSISGNDMVVTGKARLYIQGTMSISGSGQLTINSGGSLDLYLGGNASLSGNGVVNATQLAEKCVVYGLPSCTSLQFSGTSALNARIYAPSAAVRISGTFDFSGSIVANTLNFVGTPNIHYDEALGGFSAPYNYRVASWEEL